MNETADFTKFTDIMHDSDTCKMYISTVFLLFILSKGRELTNNVVQTALCSRC